MTAFEKPVLHGPRVILRDARDSDVAGRLALGNTPEIQAMFGADPAQVRDLTPEAAEAWVAAQRSEQYAWVIETEGALLGAVRLHTVNHADRRAQIAIGLLDPARLGKGLGTEAMQVLAAYAFDTMDLHRLGCRVLSFNDRAVAAYQKVGFQIEGRERESARIGNDWHDDLMLGLLAQDLKRAPRAGT